MLEPGSPAPDFSLMADSGGAISLATLAGQPAVIYFYPKDDTSGCTAEANDFSKLAAAFKKAGVAVIGVSPDSVESHKKFKAKHGLDLRLASDDEKTAASAFGVWVEKSMYGRRYMGVERSTFLLDASGRVAQVWRMVAVPGHADAVLAAAKELSNGAAKDASRQKRAKKSNITPAGAQN